MDELRLRVARLRGCGEARGAGEATGEGIECRQRIRAFAREGAELAAERGEQLALVRLLGCEGLVPALLVAAHGAIVRRRSTAINAA